MNIRHFLFVAAIAAVASCNQATSGTTTISGDFGEDAPKSITISIPEVIDTVITINQGTFSAEIPARITDMGYIEVEDLYSGTFVSDGTVLTVKPGEGEDVDVSSNKAGSVQARYSEYQKWLDGEFMDKYSAIMDEAAAVRGDEEATAKVEEKYDALMETLNERNRKLIAANKDNILALVGLGNSDFDDAEMEKIILSLAPAMQEKAEVQEILSSVRKRKGTAEGEMFTDFTVVQDPENPEASTVKLSDYVGNGKYILVDFWASWCGPCKREIPNLKKVYETYKGDNFDLLSVAVWDSPQATADTAKAYGITWNQIVNAQRGPTEIYGIQGIPHIILFGPDGKIVKRNLRGGEIAKEVAKALGK